MNGKFKKVTLEQMQRMDIYQRTSQPEVVYHMTSRENLETIRNNGYIHTGNDYVCFFCLDLKGLLTYIKLTNADEGRKYYDFDGKIHVAPPLNHAETVVLKLTPRYSEPMHWFKEILKIKTDDQILSDDKAEAQRRIQMMNDCRVCHYGNFKFKKDFEILELTDIDNMGIILDV